MALGIHYKNRQEIIREQEGATPALRFRLLDEAQIVRHGFSTRLGGVSQGPYKSLNLSFSRGDEESYVRENFQRIAKILGVKCEDMVFAQQTHTTNVRRVEEVDRGAGITKPLKWQDVDGLVTDVPGICLVTGYADCVPLFFVSPAPYVG